MPVPEAAVYKNYFVRYSKDQIGACWERSVVGRESVAEASDYLMDNQFRFRIGSTDMGHELTAFRRRQKIHTLNGMYHKTDFMAGCNDSPAWWLVLRQWWDSAVYSMRTVVRNYETGRE